MTAEISLMVTRVVHAPVERVFSAWTQPEQLKQWWGPGPTTCPEAHVDLRVGGQIRIANQTPDGVIWIEGEFREVEPPRRLVYTWSMGGHQAPPSLVTVRFDPEGAGTKISVVHTRLDSQETADSHEQGWHGCLDGLAAHLT